jgi:hypothetical protein
MLKSKWSIVVVFLCLLSARDLIWTSGAAEAQETQTIEFQVVGYGPIAGLEHNCPLDESGRLTRYVPATIVCSLRALDAEGLWTPANFSVTLSGPADRIGVEVADTLLTIRILRTTGIGGVRVTIEATPVLNLAAVYIERPLVAGRLQVDTVPPLDIAEGEFVRLCTYVGGYGTAVAKGQAATSFVCPDFRDDPLPTFPVSFRPGDSAVLMPPQPIALLARR